MHGSNAEVIPQTRRGFLRRYAGLMKWSSVVLIVISLALFARTLPLEQLVEGLQTWIEGLGVWGPVVFVLLYVLATVLLVPAWPFTVAAGAMFGLWKGTVAASVAATTTAAVAFLFARYLARERVARQVEQYPKFAAIDRAIGDGEGTTGRTTGTTGGDNGDIQLHARRLGPGRRRAAGLRGWEKRRKKTPSNT
jgi:hypothetical protein